MHFPSQNQQNVKFLPEILIFQEPLIIETWNLCHWIWHALNPKYAPLKPFQCIFPSQNQQNVKFLAVCLTVCPGYNKCCNLSHWINPKCAPKYILMHESQHCFCLKHFSGTTYHRDLKPVPGVGFGMPWRTAEICTTHRFLGLLITMHYVRTLCAWNFWFASQCTYVRDLKYLEWWFFIFGRFRHSLLKHGVGVEWDPRRTAAPGPIPFWWF